jgi:hypothetical protein
MRIRIRAEPVGPLKVLSELPDARLAVMEGLNGIGKTLAVRVLELCTGGRPYSLESAAWQSLCKGIGPLQVVINGLHGAREIRWVADTRDWVTPPDDGDSPVSFQEIMIDGKKATLLDVRRLLAVYRIGGEEGIVDTLAGMAEEAGEIVHRWARRYADPNEGPLARLDTAVATSMSLLGNWSLESYRSLVTSEQDARELIRSASKNARAYG